MVTGSIFARDSRDTGMPLRQASKLSNPKGFSLVEIMIVVLIGLVVTAIALPNMLTVIANTRLRGNIGTLSGIFQNCRMLAVKNNRVMTTHFNTASYGIM